MTRPGDPGLAASATKGLLRVSLVGLRRALNAHPLVATLFLLKI